jgi:3-methyladenine DNA glycosylase AlkD
MISCKNVAKLLMSDQVQAQSWWKRLEIRMHLARCKLCSRLALQVEQLRSAARREITDQNEADPDFEKRVLRRLSGQ